MIQEAEARSYANRGDMKSLLRRLIDDGKMSDDHAEGIEQFSNIFTRYVDYRKYKFGSSYVPVEIAMSMKEEAKNRNVLGIIDNEIDESGNPKPETTKTFKRIWPWFIYPCQKLDDYGAKMYTVPVFQSNGSKILWLITSLLLHVEPLWNILAKQNNLRKSEWLGFILVYLTKKCISHLNRRNCGIFQMLNIRDLVALFNGHINLGMFNHF